MKVFNRRDAYRELLVSWTISVLFVYFVPQPVQVLQSLKSSENDTIHVGIILKGVARGREKSHNLKMQFVTLYRSILKHNQKYNLHFVIMTDGPSVPYLEKIMRKFIVRDLKGGDISYDFFDTSAITDTYVEAISQMRPLFTSNSEAAAKYRDDLFMMGPFYHRVFPYERLIMLDADLKFRIDIAELYDHFERFSSEQVMGVAVDLAPHYRVAFRHFRERNPGTKVGEPGRLQGFNTGVVLYHLGNMRRSKLYNDYVNPENGYVATKELANKYTYTSHLGDQCFFTLLGMEHPGLFYDLPCSYNYQLDLSMYQNEFADVFPLYHNCVEEAKIYHGNGGAEIPED